MKELIVPGWLKGMPKTDLHCHMGGSIRIPTIIDLAQLYGVDLPSFEENKLKKYIVHKYNSDKSLDAYLKAFNICESVLVKPEAFERVAYEVAQDAHKEGVNIFELRFGPVNYVISGKLELNKIVGATLSGLKQAQNDFDMHNSLIICGDRTNPKKARQAFEVAKDYLGHGVVAYDLAGKENGHRPYSLQDVLWDARCSLLHITIHAGEDDTKESIKEAVGFAKRVGHGVALKNAGKDLFSYMNRENIGIEICMTSNIDTGAVSDYLSHPVMTFYDAGLVLSINTDNRTVSDTTVTNEYMHLINNFGFDISKVHSIASRGIKSAFLDHDTKGFYHDQLDAYMYEHGSQRKHFERRQFTK